MFVMMQALKEGNISCLPRGLSVLNNYTQMTTGSKWGAVIVKNLTAALITITKGVKITWVIAANAISKVGVVPGKLEKLDEMQGIQRTKMSVEQRKEALFLQLDLSGLEGWSAKDQAAACALLAEYQDISSLKHGEFGCTDLAKHEIKVIDDKPFKDRFQRIPPPMVDEIFAHMKEMLEAGMIHPSQSPWCNAVVQEGWMSVLLHWLL